MPIVQMFILCRCCQIETFFTFFYILFFPCCLLPVAYCLLPHCSNILWNWYKVLWVFIGFNKYRLFKDCNPLIISIDDNEQEIFESSMETFRSCSLIFKAICFSISDILWYKVSKSNLISSVIIKFPSAINWDTKSWNISLIKAHIAILNYLKQIKK